MPRPTSLPPPVPTDKLPPHVLDKFASAPVIKSDGGGNTASLSIAEGQGPLVTTVKATDANVSQTLTYSIVPTASGGGADADLFVMDSSTGALSFKALPDYERPKDAGGDNIFDVTVRASDGALTDTQAISIALTDTEGVILPDWYFAIVGNVQLTANVKLGIADASGGLVNDFAIVQHPIVASSAAVLNIVSTKFVVAGTGPVTSDGVDDFVYLTDAEIQTKVNALP